MHMYMYNNDNNRVAGPDVGSQEKPIHWLKSGDVNHLSYRNTPVCSGASKSTRHALTNLTSLPHELRYALNPRASVLPR